MSKRLLIPIFFLALLAPASAGAGEPLSKTPEFASLKRFTVTLEGKKSASDSAKKTYSQELTKRYKAASKEVNRRFAQNRKETWQANRKQFNKAVAELRKQYNAEIKVIKGQYKREMLDLRNDFRADAREIRREYAPAINKVKKKIAWGKKYFAGPALKKFKARQVRKMKRIIARREAQVKEIQETFLAERQILIGQRDGELLALEEDFSQARGDLDLDYRDLFAAKMVKVRGEKAAEQGRVNALRDRGRKALAAL